MTWTKIGDEFNDAAAELSDAAVRTHLDALLWSARRLLDLVVPKADLRRFAFSPSVDITAPDACPVVHELIAAGWWEDRHDAWYVGLRWPEWQRDRAQVESDRERETLKKRRQRAHHQGDHSLCSPRCSSSPVPTRAGPGTPRGLSPVVSPKGVPGGTRERCTVHGHEHSAVNATVGCVACHQERQVPA